MLDREFDQEWAIGAMVWLDRKYDLNHSKPFLEMKSNWDVMYGDRKMGSLNPKYGIETFQKIMDFTEEKFF